MSKKDDALKKALENICAAKLCEFNSMSSRHEMIRLMDAAITAIREALAEQPAQTDWEAVAADQAMTIALLKAEQPPCKYPHCPYPCPDLPDCQDAEEERSTVQAADG